MLRSIVCLLFASTAMAAEPIRIGIIGLDTSHSTAFTMLFNDPKAPGELAGFRVVAAYPKGSPDIKSSVSKVPEYTVEVRKHGVEIVESIDELLKLVDVVLLESNDGRPHAAQALPVFKAGKPMFIDKPVGGSLVDAFRIYDAAAHFNVPIFSSSGLRYVESAQAVRNGKLGRVLGADTFSPCALEPTHPDLFWYGIHGVESLFTVMGAGCKTVSRASTKDADVVVGVWSDGRIGTFRGTRSGKAGHGGHVFGEKGTETLGPFKDYKPLASQIAKFFRTRTPPVDAAETIEIYAFMEAADVSKRRGGVPVDLQTVLAEARKAATEKPLR